MPLPRELSHREVQRWIALHRRPVAAAFAFLAVLAALSAVTRPEQGSPSSSHPAVAPSPGQRAVPLPLGDDSALSMLVPGDVVDVLAADDRGADVVAAGVVVSEVPSTGEGLWSGSSGMVVVLASNEQVLALAAAAGAPLTIAVHPR